MFIPSMPTTCSQNCRSMPEQCRGTSTDVESNLNGALWKEWGKENRCPTSCCCLVLPSSISIDQDLPGYFLDPFARLQWAQAPALTQWGIKDHKTPSPPFFLGDSCRIKEVWKASGDGRQNSGRSQNIQRQREKLNLGNWSISAQA